MGHSCQSEGDVEEFAHTSQGMTRVACRAALGRVGALMRTRPAAAGLAEIAHLARCTRRIEQCLATGEDALAHGDPDTAALEWARALVLLNTLPLIAERAGREEAPAAQAPGSAG
jgi:hypothetical protein